MAVVPGEQDVGDGRGGPAHAATRLFVDHRELLFSVVYNMLGSVVSDARMAGLIDWSAIEDRTRRLQSLSAWDSPQSIVEAVSEQYRGQGLGQKIMERHHSCNRMFQFAGNGHITTLKPKSNCILKSCCNSH